MCPVDRLLGAPFAAPDALDQLRVPCSLAGRVVDDPQVGRLDQEGGCECSGHGSVHPTKSLEPVGTAHETSASYKLCLGRAVAPRRGLQESTCAPQSSSSRPSSFPPRDATGRRSRCSPAPRRTTGAPCACAGPTPGPTWRVAVRPR